MGIRAAVRWRLRRLYYRIPRLVIDLGGDQTDSIFIAGSGRTGTTWLADVLNWHDDYRNMYEPFHASRVPECAAFRPLQYLRPSNEDPRFVGPARRVFCGRIRNSWIDQYNRRVFARKRLIKDVRTTLALRWIYERFPGMPIVVTMRHPCATALSHAQMRWADATPLLLEQPDLIADHLTPFLDLLHAKHEPFLASVLQWCVEYFVMLGAFGPGEIFLTFYERLWTSPETELAELCRFIGASYDPKMLDALATPSVQATRSRRMTPSAVVSGKDPVSSWRDDVTPEQVDGARRILRRFGLDGIYGDGDTPNRDEAARHMRALPVFQPGR